MTHARRLQESQRAIESKSSEFSALEQALSASEAVLSEHERQKKSTEDQLQQQRLSLKEKEARLHVLTEVDEHQESSFTQFLEESSREQQDLAHSLKNILQVANGKEWALDIALGYFVRSMIVRDAYSAAFLASKLKERRSFTTGILIQGLSNATVPTEDQRQRFMQLGFESILNSVTPAEGWQSFTQEMLGNIFVAAEFPFIQFDELLSTENRFFFISQDGFVLTPDKRLYFWNNANRNEFSFSRQGEVARIHQELDGHRSGIQGSEESLRGLDQQTQSLREQLGTLQAKKTSLFVEKETQENNKKNIEERLLSFQQNLDLTKNELQDMIREAQGAHTKGFEIENELKQRESDEQKLHELQRQKETALEKLASERETFLLSVQQSQAQVDQSQQGIQHSLESLRMVDHHIQKDIDRAAFLDDGMNRFATKETELSADEQKCTLLREEYRQHLTNADVDLELLRQERSEQEAALSSSREEIESFQNRQKEVQDEEHQISMQTMDLDYQMKNVGERLLQRYRLNLAELNPADYPYNPEEMAASEEEIAKLQTKVDSLGTVNLLAIEEHQELKQRYDFLLSQQKDLEEARESLMEAIRKINRTTKQLFEDTFTQVQEAFKMYYQTLFRGGEARLVLIDEQHPLESGIDIVVRPPGKKLQNMSLLSGGEKALTAVALLFALFKIRPSPFCLLDEVDAPLDEANIDRFLTVLRSFIDSSQFLIITHSRKTIAMGDSLYGVTMEEPGISKIVSVKVRDGNESLPGEDLHPEVAAESSSEENKETTDTIAA